MIDIGGIDLDRVHALYTMPGALLKDVAFSLGITVAQVRKCLSARERGVRVKKEPYVYTRSPKVKPRQNNRRESSFEKRAVGFDLTRGADDLYAEPLTLGAWTFYNLGFKDGKAF